MSSEKQEGFVKREGIALIKKQFIFHEKILPACNEVSQVTGSDSSSEPSAKKKKLDRPRRRGQNKNRFNKNKAATLEKNYLCRSLVNVLEGCEFPNCDNPKCRDIHDITEYLALKPKDISSECYVFNLKGHCPRGITCRYASNHTTADGKNKINEDIKRMYDSTSSSETVLLAKELQIKLRKKSYDFSKSNVIVEEIFKEKKENNSQISSTKSASESLVPVYNKDNGQEEIEIKMGSALHEIPVKDKKIINWGNKLYLSPLTTLGNLPFRRICKEYGADITCGEMAMATAVLQGVSSEWALLRRHSSEDLFGVQICGNNAHILARCAQLIEETADVDFIDLNLGCPLELVYRNGGGCGLLQREKQLAAVVRSMAETVSVPVTVKTRTGVYDDKRVALKLMPIFSASGASLITVHGRTREQRYTKNADWDYIGACAKAAAPTPVFGNGDILSYADYNHVVSKYPDVAGVMVGRGALQKPWIFTEIKEQREWDISSKERLEILKKFVNYGLEHWGSDTRGVENTRRFLLEWLSFLYRYIPIGLLDAPQRINDRPPRYIGRDDLETLMASPNCKDWVTISEMLLGPVPDGFEFLPKHKANAWSTD